MPPPTQTPQVGDIHSSLVAKLHLFSIYLLCVSATLQTEMPLRVKEGDLKLMLTRCDFATFIFFSSCVVIYATFRARLRFWRGHWEIDRKEMKRCLNVGITGWRTYD